MKAILSLAQIKIEQGQPSSNLENVTANIEEAAKRGSQIVLLPELWSSGYDLSRGPLYAAANLDILEKLKGLAARHDLYIGGSLLLQEEDGLYNSFVFMAPSGEAVVYNKTHLFRLLAEEKWMLPGKSSVAYDAPWGRTGFATCYDLRFPELYRKYALDGAQVVLMVSAWAHKRIEHWKILARARAIENQIFLAAVNAVGKSGNEHFGGASVIVSPWGEVLAEGDTENEALLTAEIDFSQVPEIRQRIPVFQDRRPEIY
jgi:omega-amidase